MRSLAKEINWIDICSNRLPKPSPGPKRRRYGVKATTTIATSNSCMTGDIFTSIASSMTTCSLCTYDVPLLRATIEHPMASPNSG